MSNTFYFTDDDDLIDIRQDNVSIIAVVANEPPIDNLRDRQIRFDINCRAENGELVNVEMSLNPDPFEPVRLEFYAGKLFTG